MRRFGMESLLFLVMIFFTSPAPWLPIIGCVVTCLPTIQGVRWHVLTTLDYHNNPTFLFIILLYSDMNLERIEVVCGIQEKW